jgi:hypothetical protein
MMYANNFKPNQFPKTCPADLLQPFSAMYIPKPLPATPESHSNANYSGQVFKPGSV